jgi:hypothetical protein
MHLIGQQSAKEFFFLDCNINMKKYRDYPTGKKNEQSECLLCP